MWAEGGTKGGLRKYIKTWWNVECLDMSYMSAYVIRNVGWTDNIGCLCILNKGLLNWDYPRCLFFRSDVPMLSFEHVLLCGKLTLRLFNRNWGIVSEHGLKEEYLFTFHLTIYMVARSVESVFVCVGSFFLMILHSSEARLWSVVMCSSLKVHCLHLWSLDISSLKNGSRISIVLPQPMWFQVVKKSP